MPIIVPLHCVVQREVAGSLPYKCLRVVLGVQGSLSVRWSFIVMRNWIVSTDAHSVIVESTD